MMASLSRLFSESDTPYLDYRLAENLFCKYFQADNDARACTAYDAHFPTLGVGIKTFVLHGGISTEKIAEFNKIKPRLDALRGKDLAVELARCRNERMQVSNNAYSLTSALYHIVGRTENSLIIFNTPYDFVNIDGICDVIDKGVSLRFNDGLNEYIFNRSKSVLMKRFVVPEYRVEKPVEIIADPLGVLESVLLNAGHQPAAEPKRPGVDYVMLPLYSVRDNDVPQKSGLNQWNASGRKRDENEIYIPIPAKIDRYFPDFFPAIEEPFELILPDSTSLSVKRCQAGGKALMSNPNSALGEWLLRKVMGKKPGELVTMQDLDLFGFDSVKIRNLHSVNPETGMSQYSICFGEVSENYKKFIE